MFELMYLMPEYIKIAKRTTATSTCIILGVCNHRLTGLADWTTQIAQLLQNLKSKIQKTRKPKFKIIYKFQKKFIKNNIYFC